MNIKNTMSFYGTPEGVNKAWDTRGRGLHGFKSYKPEDKPKSGEEDLNGIKMKAVDAPDYSGINHDLEESPIVATKGRWASAGVIVVEKDGSFWMISPKNQYGGYRNTFPKGRIDDNETAQQAALRELWEETGLTAKINHVLGDYKRSASITRYYVGERTGGAPWAPGSDEVSSVRLMPADMKNLWKPLLNVYSNMTADHYVASDLMKHLGK